MDLIHEVIALGLVPQNVASKRIEHDPHSPLRCFRLKKGVPRYLPSRRERKSGNCVAGIAPFESRLYFRQREIVTAGPDPGELWIESTVDLIFKNHESASDSQQREKQRRAKTHPKMDGENQSPNGHRCPLRSSWLANTCTEISPFAFVSNPRRSRLSVERRNVSRLRTESALIVSPT